MRAISRLAAILVTLLISVQVGEAEEPTELQPPSPMSGEQQIAYDRAKSLADTYFSKLLRGQEPAQNKPPANIAMRPLGETFEELTAISESQLRGMLLSCTPNGFSNGLEVVEIQEDLPFKDRKFDPIFGQVTEEWIDTGEKRIRQYSWVGYFVSWACDAGEVKTSTVTGFQVIDGRIDNIHITAPFPTSVGGTR